MVPLVKTNWTLSCMTLFLAGVTVEIVAVIELTPRTMRARKRTLCRLCKLWITEGQMIGKTHTWGWVHLDCLITR